MLKKNISVIILTKDNTELLFKCLTSITKQTYIHYKVYIGDTGSNYDSILSIKKWIKNNATSFGFNNSQFLFYINNIEFNFIRGFQYDFSKNNNEIIDKYISNNTDLLLLLNNDVEILDENLFKKTIKFYAGTKNVGTVGTRLLFEDGTIQHDGIILLKNKTNKYYSWSHKNLKKDNDTHNSNSPIHLEKVFGNTGALMFIEKELYAKYKLNEQYISCFQDVELNMRLLLTGKDNYCFTNSVNFHYESVTRNKDVLNQKKLIIDMQKINDIIFSEKINENELFTQWVV